MNKLWRLYLDLLINMSLHLYMRRLMTKKNKWKELLKKVCEKKKNERNYLNWNKHRQNLMFTNKKLLIQKFRNREKLLKKFQKRSKLLK